MMPRPLITPTALILAALSAPALAQTDLEDESLREVEDALRERPNNPVPVDAQRAPMVGPVTPGVGPDPALWLDDLPVAPRAPDGTLVARRGATVFQAPTGEWVAVFEPGPRDSLDLGPMVLLPTRSRERFEVLAATQLGADENGRVTDVLALTLTGEVTLYRGRNYFLLTAFSRPESIERATEDAEITAHDVAEPSSSRLQDDPEIADLLADLEQRRDTPRGLQNPVRDPNTLVDVEELDAATDGRRAFITLRDGEPMSRQTGRLVRSGAGEPLFVSDTGIGSEGGAEGTDGPLVLLPNLVTQRLESLAGARSDGIKLEVSGRLYVFDRRAYLLPSFYSVAPPSEITAAQ